LLKKDFSCPTELIYLDHSLWIKFTKIALQRLFLDWLLPNLLIYPGLDGLALKTKGIYGVYELMFKVERTENKRGLAGGLFIEKI